MMDAKRAAVRRAGAGQAAPSRLVDPGGGAGAAHRRHRRRAQDGLRSRDPGRHLRARPDLQDRHRRRAQRGGRDDADGARLSGRRRDADLGGERRRSVPGVGQVTVKLTFDPPWDQGRMSDEARLALGHVLSCHPGPRARDPSAQFARASWDGWIPATSAGMTAITARRSSAACPPTAAPARTARRCGTGGHLPCAGRPAGSQPAARRCGSRRAA